MIKIIALILILLLFIIGLVVVYFNLSNKVASAKWPPRLSSCPDYWIEGQNANDETICTNEKNLGLSTCPDVISSDILAKSECEKSKWARSCNLTWDGITNKTDICK